MRIDRRGVGLVAAVVAALALVVVAARGNHAQHGASAAGPAGVSSATQLAIAVVMAVAAVALIALLVWTLATSKGEHRERPKRSKLVLIGVLGLMVVLAIFAKTRHLEQRAATPELHSATTVVEDHAPPPTSTTRPAWPLAAAGLAALACGAVVVARRSRSAPDADEPLAGSAVPVPEVAVDLAVTCDDPRQAVLLAFEAAEALLAAEPTTRRPATASAREWSSTVRLPALTRLVERYEIARFSHHAVTAEDRAVALDALRSLA